MRWRDRLKKTIERLIVKCIPDIRNAFLAAIQDINSTASLVQLVRAIREGDVDKAFRATGLSPAAMRPLSAMIERAYETGGISTMQTFPTLTTDAGATIFRFDVRNSRGEAALRDHSSQLVTRIDDEAKTNIRTIMQAGLKDGRNPRNVALDIIGRVDPTTGRRTGGIIGLTDQQTQWVTNMRRELVGVPDKNYFNRVQRDKRFDRIVQKAINSGTPLTAEKIEALTARYSDNLLQLRGETIARTETIWALNKSQDEAMRQAVDTGTIQKDQITKKWDATGDLRTRPTHMVLDGQKVDLDGSFRTAYGARLMFPGDTSLGAPASETINCRCRVEYDVDWLAGDLTEDDD